MYAWLDERMNAQGYDAPPAKRKNRAKAARRASFGSATVSAVSSAATIATRSLSAQSAKPAPLSAASHATHSSRASAAASNVSVSESTPFVAVTVSAACTGRTALAATAKAAHIIRLFIVVPFLLFQND